MPSRLLDWSISPLIALFMCVFPERRHRPREKSVQQVQREEDGVIYAMDPEGLDPPGYICHQHDPMVKEAIEVVTMWNDQHYEETDKPAKCFISNYWCADVRVCREGGVRFNEFVT